MVDLSQEFFHVCDRAYAPGDVKVRGTYGDLVLDVPAGTPVDDRNGENLREAVRVQFYPASPSRFKSTFVWETLADAVFFRDTFKKTSPIYRVRFTDQTAPAHRVCFTAFRMPDGPHDPPATVLAHEFWRSPPAYVTGNEVFAESDIEILGLALPAPSAAS